MFTIRTARAFFRPGFAAGIALALLSAATAAARADTCTQPVDCPSSVPGQCTLPPKPNTLWCLVDCCKNKTAPNCERYADGKADQYMIVKDTDPHKTAAYLIVPTQRVNGIECDETLATPLVDIWERGWYRATTDLKAQLKGDVALAINSQTGRDQNQLHIHISCVKAAVLSAVSTNDGKIGTDPAHPFSLELGTHGNSYEIVKVQALTGENSPFKVIRKFPHVTPTDIGQQSIAVIGGKEAGTWYVLNTFAHGTDRGDAEELLDQACSGK